MLLQLFSCKQLCWQHAENLCLYGHPDGQWLVDLPAEEVPPEMPEPSLGYALLALALCGAGGLSRTC